MCFMCHKDIVLPHDAVDEGAGPEEDGDWYFDNGEGEQ